MKKPKLKPGWKALRMVRDFFPQVTSVIDADEAIVIEVTAADNNSAAVKKHKHCALAVACKRKTKADGVIVGTTTAYVVEGFIATRYKLLESTSREIVSFDRHADFDVGAYRLRAPAKREKLGIKRDQTRSNKNSGRTSSRLRHYTRGVRTVLGASVGTS